MRLKNNRSGFTLLEIIIVIIIVGVLASLALPRFFNTIAFSRATEALNTMGVIKRGADRCATMAGAANGTADYTTCDTFAGIGIEDPGPAQVPGANFTYAITPFAAPNWQIVATRVGAPLDTITLDYNVSAAPGTPAVARSGTGSFSGLQ